MSLIGKILAFLNILGAIGLIYFASADYAKRRVWAHSKLRHDLVLRGLPLDQEEQASNEEPIADLLDQETLGKMFNDVGGNPVKTQLEEVNRVKGLLDAKIQPTQGKLREQSVLLARILLPITDDHVERDQLLSCRSLLASDASLKQFKDRYRAALRGIDLAPVAVGTPRTFEEEYRAALRAQLGETADTFTSMLLKALPNDPKKAADVFDTEFDKTLEAQRKQFLDRYNKHFDDALKGPQPNAQGSQAQAVDLQKTAIARLLFGLSLFLAEDEVEKGTARDAAQFKGLSPDSRAFGERLAGSETYTRLVRRVMTVCGLKRGLDAIGNQAAVERKLVDYLVAAMSEEKLRFVADHAAFVELLRKQAALLQAELALVAVSEEKLSLEKVQVDRRQQEVKRHQDEFKELQAKTAESVADLRKLSQDLLDRRIDARDLIRQALETEKFLRTLSEKVQALEQRQ